MYSRFWIQVSSKFALAINLLFNYLNCFYHFTQINRLIQEIQKVCYRGKSQTKIWFPFYEENHFTFFFIYCNTIFFSKNLHKDFSLFLFSLVSRKNIFVFLTQPSIYSRCVSSKEGVSPQSSSGRSKGESYRITRQ